MTNENRIIEITEIIKDVISIPIQSLTSRPENFAEKNNPNQNKKWNNQNDDNSFKKVNPIDVIFILKDEFEGKKALDDKQYAIIKPVKVGISGENYYAVESLNRPSLGRFSLSKGHPLRIARARSHPHIRIRPPLPEGVPPQRSASWRPVTKRA